jgi:hypothetical protein
LIKINRDIAADSSGKKALQGHDGYYDQNRTPDDLRIILHVPDPGLFSHPSMTRLTTLIHNSLKSNYSIFYRDLPLFRDHGANFSGLCFTY